MVPGEKKLSGTENCKGRLLRRPFFGTGMVPGFDFLSPMGHHQLDKSPGIAWNFANRPLPLSGNILLLPLGGNVRRPAS
jgi:hypothetical protein